MLYFFKSYIVQPGLRLRGGGRRHQGRPDHRRGRAVQPAVGAMVSLKINYFFTVNYFVFCGVFFQVQRPRHPRRDRRALHGQGQGHRGPRRRGRDTAFRVRFFFKKK